MLHFFWSRVKYMLHASRYNEFKFKKIVKLNQIYLTATHT